LRGTSGNSPAPAIFHSTLFVWVYDEGDTVDYEQEEFSNHQVVWVDLQG